MLFDDESEEARLEQQQRAEAKAIAVRERLERERQQILTALSGAEPSTVRLRVALILNKFPDTRNSDIALLLRYWETFTDYRGGAIYPDDLYNRPSLVTLTRERQRIQNQLNLFL
jgi:hypothetical protein